MQPAQNMKFVGFKFSSNNSAHEHKFDTQGARYLVIQMCANGGSGTAFAEQPNLSECATEGGSYVAITGAALSGLTSPADAAADAGTGVFFVDLKGRERFIKLDYQAGQTANVASIGHLVDNTEAPITAATSDYASRVIV